MVEALASLYGGARASGRFAWLELRRATGGRWLYQVGGCLVWFIIVALWNALGMERPMEGSSVLNGVIAAPAVLLSFFLGSQVVASDQENRSLEVVLSLPRGRTQLWVMRLLVAAAFAWGVSILLAALSWLLVSRFPLLTVWIHSLWPVAFFVALSFLLSVLLRSGTAAALVTSLVLGLIFLTHQLWWTGPLSYVYPFLNPLLPPDGMTPETWSRAFAANRIGVLVATLGMVVGGLRLMAKRERLI